MIKGMPLLRVAALPDSDSEEDEADKSSDELDENEERPDDVDDDRLATDVADVSADWKEPK